MKLLRELSEEVKYITEDKEGKKNLYIEGIFLQSEIQNRNGRIYPKEIRHLEATRSRSDGPEALVRSGN